MNPVSRRAGGGSRAGRDASSPLDARQTSLVCQSHISLLLVLTGSPYLSLQQRSESHRCAAGAKGRGPVTRMSPIVPEDCGREGPEGGGRLPVPGAMLHVSRSPHTWQSRRGCPLAPTRQTLRDPWQSLWSQGAGRVTNSPEPTAGSGIPQRLMWQHSWAEGPVLFASWWCGIAPR